MKTEGRPGNKPSGRMDGGGHRRSQHALENVAQGDQGRSGVSMLGATVADGRSAERIMLAHIPPLLVHGKSVRPLLVRISWPEMGHTSRKRRGVRTGICLNRSHLISRPRRRIRMPTGTVCACCRSRALGLRRELGWLLGGYVLRCGSQGCSGLADLFICVRSFRNQT